ncbi:hypothetical protein A0256_11470 [Mucilaginibacter sp. PAMC 26640]|nr:hypothetical protein A0256_11470 [Mucilaginibacter sp. PAMC 26640]
MSILKKLLPNNLKQEGKYLLLNLLKMPFNRAGVPVDITEWVPNRHPINFIDIGASKGNFSHALNTYYQVNKAVLIDPIPHNAAALQHRFTTGNFTVINAAVSDKASEADFYITEEFDVLSSLFPMKDEHLKPFNIPHPQKTTVKTDTLDKIFNGLKLDKIDLIKIDLQGAEHLVLSNAARTLKATRAVYTEFSYKPMYDGSSTFFDVFEMLTKANFRMVNTSTAYKLNNGEIVQGDALFINNNEL